MQRLEYRDTEKRTYEELQGPRRGMDQTRYGKKTLCVSLEFSTLSRINFFPAKLHRRMVRYDGAWEFEWLIEFEISIGCYQSISQYLTLLKSPCKMKRTWGDRSLVIPPHIQFVPGFVDKLPNFTLNIESSRFQRKLIHTILSLFCFLNFLQAKLRGKKTSLVFLDPQSG